MKIPRMSEDISGGVGGIEKSSQIFEILDTIFYPIEMCTNFRRAEERVFSGIGSVQEKI